MFELLINGDFLKIFKDYIQDSLGKKFTTRKILRDHTYYKNHYKNIEIIKNLDKNIIYGIENITELQKLSFEKIDKLEQLKRAILHKHGIKFNIYTI